MLSFRVGLNDLAHNLTAFYSCAVYGELFNFSGLCVLNGDNNSTYLIGMV